MARLTVQPRITGVGAHAPIGRGGLQVAMCARAAKLEPRSCAYRDRRGAPIGVCRVPSLADDLHGFERWVALGAPALRECAWGVASRPPLFLALPEEGRPDDDARIGAGLVEALASASGAAIDAPRSALFRSGSAGFAMALEAAIERLAAGDEAAIVGGVESYYHPAVLAWLDADARLHSESVDGGILPSEGAAFVLLSRGDARPRDGGGAAVVLGVEVDREASVLSGEPNLARAMTGLVRRVAQGGGGEGGEGRADWVLSDCNGERHRVNEWSMVATRSRDILPEGAQHDRFAEEIGDLGAASGAVLLVIASVFWRAGCAPSDTALVALHSDGPERAVILAGRGS